MRLAILTLYHRRIWLVDRYLHQHYARCDLLHLHGSELQLPAMTAGRLVPQLLVVPGLASQYPPFVPGGLSWLKVLRTLAGYYERRYLPAIQGFINTVCEAHVAGLPVIVADVGGMRLLVADEVTGLIYTLEPAHLAAQALRLLRDALLRQRLAAQAAAVARRHGPATIVVRTLTIYQEVLAAALPHPRAAPGFRAVRAGARGGS